MNIKNLFNKPCVIGICADVNQGKSMLLYYLLDAAKAAHTYKLFYYGLRLDVEGIDSRRIYSVAELENIRDALIIVDELSSLFDLDNRKSKRAIENTLRLINHNNNILVLCGTPENFKKFISAKLNKVLFKKSSFADFINGSNIKNIALSYNGYERGAELLNIPISQVLYFDGLHYELMQAPYIAKYDTKTKNQAILKPIPTSTTKRKQTRKININD